MFLSVNFKNFSRTLFYVEHFQGTATKGNWKLMGARRGSIIWKWERKTGAKRCSWTVCFYQTEKPSYIQKWIYSFMGNHICYNIFSLRALIFCSYLSGIYLRHQTVSIKFYLLLLSKLCFNPIFSYSSVHCIR